jgi:hypothetical protein
MLQQLKPELMYLLRYSFFLLLQQHYSVTLTLFYQTLGVEWGEHGIRVISVAPGPIEGTVGGPGGRVFGVGDGDFLEKPDFTQSPLGRWGTVEDISNTVLFISSDGGANITATNIVVDGGHWHGTSGFYHGLKDLVSAKSDEERKSFKGGVQRSRL